MDIRELLKKLMDEQNVTQADLAKSLDISRAAVWDRLNSKKLKDMGINQVDEMLGALNYRVMIVPDDVKKPTGAYELR